MQSPALSFAPFTSALCASAARLLAERHAADRRREPALPSRTAFALRRDVEATFALPSAAGVVALRGERLVGFMLGVPTEVPPQHSLAPFFAPQSVRVPYGAHAVEASEADALYRALYAALAADWVRAGLLAQYVQLPATSAAALAIWHALGFGHDMGLAMRDTSPLVAAHGAGTGLQIRRATAADSAAVWALERELARHESAAPVFFPALPEAESAARAELDALLADPATICWLAERDGQALGTLTCVPPPRHISPLLTPDRTLNIAACAVTSAARGAGVGTALLAHTLAWARAAGFDWMRLTWMTANPLSSRFWSSHNFRPVMYRLARRVDERAVG